MFDGDTPFSEQESEELRKLDGWPSRLRTMGVLLLLLAAIFVVGFMVHGAPFTR